MFKTLTDFITQQMRMSHVYQPVMLMTLLRSGGEADETAIARNLVFHDQSQIEYYTKITNNMVGRVLRKHGIVERDRIARSYRLVGFEHLSSDEIDVLLQLCQEKLNDFMTRRGGRIYQHRRTSIGYISGTVRYEVLKRARYRCELCGISADEKALEVDHILPRAHGGTDDPTNLQALCYSCNAMKRHTDDTDFRLIRDSYEHREESCAFCTIPTERVLFSNRLAYAIRDGFPVTRLHSLIIPKRHATTYFELGQAEINACTELLREARLQILTLDSGVGGFNVGINNGEAAGQTIFHSHIHLIPRRAGDIDNPRGGVRNTIPGQGGY